MKQIPPFRLAVHGDWLERRYWSLFLRTEFPSYERFWLLFVAPLTSRDKTPADIRFKTDTELGAMSPPRTFYDLYLAQLNYSVLWHLAAVHDLRIGHGSGGWDTNAFVYAMVRLCSALDAADELLELDVQGSLSPDPWKAAFGARKRWRDSHPPDRFLRDLQDYRHQLVHSGPFMHTDSGPYFPKVGMHRDYRDWRKATRPLTPKQRAQFAIAGAIVEDAWGRVVRYLERSWRTMLKGRGVKRLHLPDLRLNELLPQDSRHGVLGTTTPNFKIDHVMPFEYIVDAIASSATVVTSSATPGEFRLWNPAGDQPSTPAAAGRKKRQ